MIGNIVAGTFSAGVAPVTSSYESIASSTLGSSQSSITFSDGGAWADYKHLQLRVMLRGTDSRTNVSGYLRFNSDSGNNYSSHNLYGNGSSAGSDANGLGNSSVNLRDLISAGSLSNTFHVLIIDILDFANTSKNKTVRILGGNDKNGGGTVSLQSGAWYNTNAITSMNISLDNGDLGTYSSFALYGIKD